MDGVGIGQVAETITDRLYGYFNSRRRVSPARSNRASSLGDACDRKLVYARTAWRHAAPPDVSLQMIFEDGIAQEKAWAMRMMDAGFDLDKSQQSLEWPEYQISGHIDGRIRIPGDDASYLYEFKSMSAFGYQRTREWRDFLLSPYYHHYPAQISAYLLMNNEDTGLFILTARGQFRVLPVEVDYQYAESVLQQAERVNQHIENGTLPDQITKDFHGIPAYKFCEICPYLGHCAPDQRTAEGLVFVDDAQMEEWLVDRASNEPGKRAFDKADKKIKDVLSKMERPGSTHLLNVADWIIDGKKDRRGAWRYTFRVVDLQPKTVEDEADDDVF